MKYTDRIHHGDVQCTRTVTLLRIVFVFFYLINFFFGHNFQAIKAINFKLQPLIAQIVDKCSIQET